MDNDVVSQSGTKTRCFEKQPHITNDRYPRPKTKTKCAGVKMNQQGLSQFDEGAQSKHDRTLAWAENSGGDQCHDGHFHCFTGHNLLPLGFGSTSRFASKFLLAIITPLLVLLPLQAISNKK
jgi:hypothetical protein